MQEQHLYQLVGGPLDGERFIFDELFDEAALKADESDENYHLYIFNGKIGDDGSYMLIHNGQCCDEIV